MAAADFRSWRVPLAVRGRSESFWKSFVPRSTAIPWRNMKIFIFKTYPRPAQCKYWPKSRKYGVFTSKCNIFGFGFCIGVFYFIIQQMNRVRRAVIDVGTNSVKLLVADVQGGS